jgi:hypothetical protein
MSGCCGMFILWIKPLEEKSGKKQMIKNICHRGHSAA